MKGYVIAKLVFTADAGTLKKLSVDPVVFVVNDAFSEIYNNGRVESGKISKYNLKDMTDRVKEKVNARLNGPVIQEILIDGINYVDKNDIRTVANQQQQSSKGQTRAMLSRAIDPKAREGRRGKRK